MLRRATSACVPRIRHTAACVCPACSMPQLRALSTLARSGAMAVAPVRAACAAVALPCPAAAPAPRPTYFAQQQRSMHFTAARCAQRGGDKNDAEDNDEELDLFDETDDGSSGSAGDMASLLATARQAAVQQPSTSSASEAQMAAYAASSKLLSKANPPRLEPKHYDALRQLLLSLRAKLDQYHKNALESAAAQGLSESDAVWSIRQDKGYQALSADEAWVAALCRQLFPPEQVLDDKKVGELLDYAESMPGVMHLVQPDAVDPMKLMAIHTKTTRQNRHMFCLFCKPSTAILPRNQLNYTNLNLLVTFLNERGMIIQRDESRLCMKHQRAVARTIKRARSIGLLSPMSNWRVPHELVYGKDGNKGSSAAADAATIAAGGALRPTRQQQAGATSQQAQAEQQEEARFIEQLEDDFTSTAERSSRK